jgi:hypothetical protein
MHLVWQPIRLALFGLLGALLLGRASVAANPQARDEGPLHAPSVATTAGGRVHSGAAESECRLPSRWILRWHRHSLAFFKLAHGDDPNDDETSDDPNDDDDAWDDLSCYYDMDVPLMAWLLVTVPSAIAPDRAPGVWTAPHYPPTVTGQRLRC